MDLGLAGRRCAVAGASRGIGLATARMLCAEGADVLLIARGAASLDGAVAECRAIGRGSAQPLALDVTAPDAGEKALRACSEHFGGLDVLVVCAGTTRVRALEELTEEDFAEQWALSVLAPWRLMAAAAPAMAERGWGRIVNVSSSSGKRPSLTNAAYSTGKAAQLSLSRAFADAYAAKGVLVNAVTPGVVATGLWTGPGGLAEQAAAARGVTPAEALEQQAAKIPRGQAGSAEEIAAVIVFLCSEQAANVAGAAWSADGGSVQVII